MPPSPTRPKRDEKVIGSPVRSKTKSAELNIVTPVATVKIAAAHTPKTSGRKKKQTTEVTEVNDSTVPETDNSRVLASPFNVSKITVTPEVNEIYKLVKKATGALGGNGSTGAIYGECTMRGLQRPYNILMEKCGLGPNSRLIDVGAGLGKPNFHAAQDPGVRLSIGVELEEIRWKVFNFPYLVYMLLFASEYVIYACCFSCQHSCPTKT